MTGSSVGGLRRFHKEVVVHWHIYFAAGPLLES